MAARFFSSRIEPLKLFVEFLLRSFFFFFCGLDYLFVLVYFVDLL